MRRLLLTLSLLVVSTGLASAQYGPPEVPPGWNQYGSAVCPDGYDYAAQINSCVARGGYGGGYYRRGYGGYGGGGGLPARWNRYGSAVCPPGYDYIAAYNGCFPQ
jgi:hypothetical protein